MNNILISTDKKKLNIELIYDFLSNSYWAKGRTKAQVEKSIENARCYGIYLEKEQIGFARIVTDKVVFAYLMDVFIVDNQRGKGYASQLMNAILKDEEIAQVQNWFLRTNDAQPFYEKLGFVELENPEKTMIKRIK